MCEVRFLNRVTPPFGKAPERIEIEADPIDSELLIENSGLQTNSKGVNTPGQRTRDSSCTIKLSPQDSTSYRSNVMRLAYLSADRIELQLAIEELARSMAEPTRATATQTFAGMSAEQEEHEFMTSTTQAVVSLSSAEAEFHATVKAAAAGIDCVSMIARSRSDVAATRSRSQSERVGPRHQAGLNGRSSHCKCDEVPRRIRHIATPTLWLQRLVINGDIKMTRVRGSDHCADLGTKHLDDRTKIGHLVVLCNACCRRSESDCTPVGALDGN